MIEKQDNRTEKRITGDKGEEIACMFLMKQGFSCHHEKSFFLVMNENEVLTP